MKTVIKDLSKLTDAQLLSLYSEGQESAFREIVNRYKSGLYTFLRQFLNRQDLVEDVFQETFLQLFTSRESFDTSRPLRPWLFTIAANKAKDALRKWQRTSAVRSSSPQTVLIAQYRSDESMFADISCIADRRCQLYEVLPLSPVL